MYENSLPNDRETRTGTRLSGGTVGSHCLLGLRYRLCDILVALHKFHCRFCVPDLCILPKRTRCDAVGHSIHVDRHRRSDRTHPDIALCADCKALTISATEVLPDSEAFVDEA